MWVALPVLGVAVITLPQLVSLFFEREYGFGPTGRGLVTFLSGVGITLGLALGQRLGTRALAQDRPERLGTVVGLVGRRGRPGPRGDGALAVRRPSPPPATWSPASASAPTSRRSSRSPAWWLRRRLRGQAFAYSILLLGVGGLLSPLLAALGTGAGYRTALGVLAVSLGAGGLALLRTAATVATDALLAQATSPTAALGRSVRRGPSSAGAW